MWAVYSLERRRWACAHRLARQLRASREELRNALSQLGLAILYGERTFVFDLRQAVGPKWFDNHYTKLLNRSKE